ncbi:cardiolipin synthase [Ligilactobacillus saerimneri]|uniref:Cardiolipin synthase n=1 Tax=Ligilactobacillus saerimneri 30a TaxID=1227363 RepID=M5J497_9LACO|nr:cardiolipin synthase [Ligilactobacillus saerimneri]EKW98963.1 cardiolipin synthetase [Ligilactobacillus saerimneri 30a]MBU5309362.1 cardiolipin synthase [Ligilactobacillus saerimneri]MDY4003242.1 cardiolipin synthase [Ligilactobacillus saerimneri]HJF29414.1 cardiolipin synthase [Ligilactobacillus saerimneri]
MHSMIGYILLALLVINTGGAVVTVFWEKKDIAVIWAWLLVLILLPGVGFILYLLVGKGINSSKIFDLKEQERLGINQLAEIQKEQWEKNRLIFAGEKISAGNMELPRLFLDIDQAILTEHNYVEILTDGTEKFKVLLDDIRHAQNHVHIEYYTFYNDQIGNQVRAALEEVARRGVEVRVIYDSFGSRGTTHQFFKRLEALGGRAEPFFGTKKAPIHSPRLNYRDHRKIVVIDGRIGYIGGFNIGDQYLGRKPKFGYWRDTHLRVQGNAVIALQSRFLMDWNATVKNTRHNQQVSYQDQYFPLISNVGHTSMQIVSSGPDSEKEAIKLGYFKMINNARKYIYIQTPYLIPDDAIIEALMVAQMSGVEVRIMIPAFPDHPFVYRATEYYAKHLTDLGIKVYKYHHGFLHAKTVVVDDQVASVGSANLDFRSFKLNFEANAFLYGEQFAHQLKTIFEKDQEQAVLLTPEYFAKQSRWRKFKQEFSRLLSPIL